jgi:acetyl esterase/lipase
MKLLTFLLVTVTLLGYSQQRYLDSLFSVQQSDVDRVYATAPQLQSPYAGESATQSVNLKMHIFQPVGDSELKRPMLLCFHGGAFVSGNKDHDDMIAFCRTFAAKGYVTATAQYRLGMNASSAVSGARAVYRGLQDGRAAIRHLRANASSLKIDTNKIFVLGSSAGAFIGLQVIYMNTSAERPAETQAISHFPPTLDDGPDLGGFDAIEPSNTGGGLPNAVVSLWGAIKDTTLIAATDAIPVLLIHGTADIVVPYGVGSPFNNPLLPATHGSDPIHRRLTNLGIAHATYFVIGAPHEFYGVANGMWNPAPNAYWDTVLTRVTGFLYPRVTSVSVDGPNVVPETIILHQNHPNPFNPETAISFTLPRTAHVSLKVHDLMGREVGHLVDGLIGPGTRTVRWEPRDLSTGVYLCRLVASGDDGRQEVRTQRMLLLR